MSAGQVFSRNFAAAGLVLLVLVLCALSITTPPHVRVGIEALGYTTAPDGASIAWFSITNLTSRGLVRSPFVTINPEGRNDTNAGSPGFIQLPAPGLISAQGLERVGIPAPTNCTTWYPSFGFSLKHNRLYEAIQQFRFSTLRQDAHRFDTFASVLGPETKNPERPTNRVAGRVTPPSSHTTGHAGPRAAVPGGLRSEAALSATMIAVR